MDPQLPLSAPKYSYPPPPPPVTPSSSTNPDGRYHECQRNYAAALGTHVFDGCGEFMPDGNDHLKCAACTCHRSFHRKETADVTGHHQHHHGRAAAQRFPLLLPPPPHPPASYPHHTPKHFQLGGFPASPFGPVNTSGSGGTTTESSSEERLDPAGSTPRPGGPCGSPRKRFRTKFTPEQKERMQEFAERVGWRIQKQDEGLVEQLCAEVGVRRQVLKVWLHNNKHSVRKQQQHLLQTQQQQSQHQQQL